MKDLRGVRLGRIQQSVFGVLQEHGEWWDFAPGWTWGTTTETKKILESLVRRGVVLRHCEAGRAGITYRPRST